jgi:hypothetical protein
MTLRVVSKRLSKMSEQHGQKEQQQQNEVWRTTSSRILKELRDTRDAVRDEAGALPRAWL